jgi:hypothetical protein
MYVVSTLLRTLPIAALSALLISCATTTPDPTSNPDCPSPIVDRGGGWREVGGPEAWLLFAPPYFETSRGPHMLWVRLERSAGPVALTARLPDGSEAEGFVQWEAPVALSSWAPGAGPPPDLGGRVVFAGVPFAEPGCWELVFETNGDELGVARIEVQALPRASPTEGR